MVTIDVITICVTFGGVLLWAIVLYMQNQRYYRDLDQERQAEERAKASGHAT